MEILQRVTAFPTIPIPSAEVLTRSSVMQSAPQRCKILFKEIKRPVTDFFWVASMNNGEFEPVQLRISLPEGREKMHCKVWMIAMNPGVSVFEERLSQLNSVTGACVSRPLGGSICPPSAAPERLGSPWSPASYLPVCAMPLKIPSDWTQLKQAWRSRVSGTWTAVDT